MENLDGIDVEKMQRIAAKYLREAIGMYVSSHPPRDLEDLINTVKVVEEINEAALYYEAVCRIKNV